MIRAENDTLLDAALQKLEGVIDARLAGHEARLMKEIAALQKRTEQLELRDRDRADENDGVHVAGTSVRMVRIGWVVTVGSGCDAGGGSWLLSCPRLGVRVSVSLSLFVSLCRSCLFVRSFFLSISLSLILSFLLALLCSFSLFLSFLSSPLLSSPLLSYPIHFNSVWFPVVWFGLVSYPVLSYPIEPNPIQSNPILSYPFRSLPFLVFWEREGGGEGGGACVVSP